MTIDFNVENAYNQSNFKRLQLSAIRQLAEADGRADPMFTVYAIVSESTNKIYIGQTIDITKRLLQHNGTGNNHLGQYTANKGPWRLVYSEDFSTRSEALKREKQLKSFRGREFVRSKI